MTCMVSSVVRQASTTGAGQSVVHASQPHQVGSPKKAPAPQPSCRVPINMAPKMALNRRATKSIVELYLQSRKFNVKLEGIKVPRPR